MRFRVLGETAVRTEDGRAVRVPERKVRTLLAALLADAGRPAAVHRLVDALWGDEPPGNPPRALQAKVSQLRRALEEAEPGGRELVVSRAPGYLLAVPQGALDTHLFAELTARARAAGDPRERVRLLTEALGLWRGPAFADFADQPFARAAADRWEEERLVAREMLAEARLALGEADAVVGELTELVALHPLRERLRAVHLRALYRAGRQSEALAGYEELRALLAGELGLDPGPELAALHTAMLRQDPALSAPFPASASPVPASASPVPASASPVPASGPVPVPAEVRGPGPRGNLPVPLTGIVGREKAVEEVRALLRERRLVTLTGPGGVGKTRLAVEAAARLREDFPDGVWLVEFAGAGGELAEVVAAALELRDGGAWGLLRGEGRPPTTAERLAEVLHGRRVLLVLDNCEHVVDEAASLAEQLLRTAPGLTVLTTSQEPLALAGETLWAVEPLDPEGAAELFVARATASAPGLALDDEALEAVRAVCRRLDGIPLALELAATRVRALGVHGLLERLDDRFRLLDAGLRGAPVRQQTLRAVIDWSWELLGDPERTVLRRLAVHAEGCTLSAAEEVCAGDGVAPGDVLGLLARLVDRSLVVAVDGPEGPRYRLLESVAAYCLERLRDAGEREPVRARHLAHYTRLAETARSALRGPAQRRWLARLDAETPNLRAALDRALGLDDGGPSASGYAAPGKPLSGYGAPDPSYAATARPDTAPQAAGSRAHPGAALRLVDALAWYWVLRGRLGEGLRSATAALRAPGTDAPELAGLRARVEIWRTGLAVMGGDGTDRAHRITEALAAHDATDDEGGRPWARWFLAHALCGTGGQVEGAGLTGRALDGFRAAGDRWGEAAALADRSVQRLLRGDLAGAEADAARADALFEELGDACCRLWTVYPLATVAEVRGAYERADRLKRAGLAAAESFGLTTEVPDLLAGLGRTALLRGDFAEARAYHEAARERAAEVGFRAAEINAVLGLGLGARREGRTAEAEGHMREVLDWHRSVGLDHANGLILAELGFSALARGDLAEALALQTEGYATALASGDPRAVALALEGLASVLVPVGRPRGAALLLGAAEALRAATGAPLAPAERADVDRAEAAARAALGEPAFTTASARGAALPPRLGLAAPAGT
ncbi:BTAD domain-containing putative transcriptional regulator [Streptomyces sp. NPDC126503]|uniref:AfsR/SARP family transcriptional regulator n=1 Tax=Streptomyces sp. NPDC126503 TaxID=3155315 RepID=UPI00332C3914